MKVISTIVLILCSFQLGLAQDTIQKTEKVNHLKTSILGLRTVVYKVGDIQKATAWYAKAFETEAYFVEVFYVGFNIGGYELGLLPEENPTQDKTETVIAYWGVNNIQESYDRLIRLGAGIHEEPNNVGGDLMVASVKDPWGNIIGLIYNPAFKLEEDN